MNTSHYKKLYILKATIFQNTHHSRQSNFETTMLTFTMYTVYKNISSKFDIWVLNSQEGKSPNRRCKRFILELYFFSFLGLSFYLSFLAFIYIFLSLYINFLRHLLTFTPRLKYVERADRRHILLVETSGSKFYYIRHGI